MENITIGTKVKSKLHTSITGEVVRLFEDRTAIILLEGKRIQNRKMAVCLKYWDVI